VANGADRGSGEPARGDYRGRGIEDLGLGKS
jgi:hypothetical protein